MQETVDGTTRGISPSRNAEFTSFFDLGRAHLTDAKKWKLLFSEYSPKLMGFYSIRISRNIPRDGCSTKGVFQILNCPR
jgi:hypothetical protein